MKCITNTEGYAYFKGEPNIQPRQTLTVTFITDYVPGAFHDPKDLMSWIASNSYVDTVTLEPEETINVALTKEEISTLRAAIRASVTDGQFCEGDLFLARYMALLVKLNRYHHSYLEDCDSV